MKKIFLICLSIICAAVAYADGYKTCKVAGTTGTVEVSVYETDKENGTAIVSFSNDTDQYVNVSATIYFNGAGTYRSVTKLVPPRSEATVEVSCGKEYTSAKVDTVAGNKCQK